MYSSIAYPELTSKVDSEAAHKVLEAFAVKHRDLLSIKLKEKKNKLREVIPKLVYFWWVIFLLC